MRRYSILSAALAVAAITLGGCASLDIRPANEPTALPTLSSGATISGGDVLRTTMVGLAFSGGGMRASAFSYGVLKGLDAVDMPGGGTLLDQVRFVSGVSGGSVTAAYFGLKGRKALDDFDSRFLYRNAEEGLRTSTYNVGNLARALDSGVNDRSGFPDWLRKNLFGGATFRDMMRPGRPLVWINASDIVNKTPFIFEPVTFGALCSNLQAYPVADAVAASAAVPIVFAPVVIQSYADRCGYQVPTYLDQMADRRDAPPNVRVYAQALRRYRDISQGQFVKLLDGGLIDNWGLVGINVALAAAPEPYKPLTREDAVALQRFLFVVVDSGQTARQDASKTLEGPSGSALLEAVTATAIDSSVRNSFEVLRLQMNAWQQRLVQWRCSLPAEEVTRIRGTTEGWNCQDIAVQLERVSFEDLDPATAARLGNVPTRFVLEKGDVKAIIDAGVAAVRKVLGDGER
jgi:NTE family protein